MPAAGHTWLLFKLYKLDTTLALRPTSKRQAVDSAIKVQKPPGSDPVLPNPRNAPIILCISWVMNNLCTYVRIKRVLHMDWRAPCFAVASTWVKAPPASLSKDFGCCCRTDGNERHPDNIEHANPHCCIF